MAFIDDIDAIPPVTNAQLLKVYRYALAQGAFRTTLSINGRMITVPGPKEVLAIIEALEGKVADESTDAGGGIGLVVFGERT